PFLLAAVALVGVAAATAWLPGLGVALERKGEPRSVDAIVLTYGAMMTPSGIAEADRLYRAGWANVIVLSDFHPQERAWDGGYLRPLVRRQLLRRGVPDAALLDLGPLPDNESEEASVLRDLFAARGWHSALLVARDYRVRRTVASINRATAPGSIDLI